MKLNQLQDNTGANKARIRVGRGIASGKGKTAGRGMKGQKSRSGVAVKGFEGGQMPIIRRLPKRGFNNRNRKVYSAINLYDLQRAIDSGKLDAGKTIDEAILLASGLMKKSTDGVKILSVGEIKAKLTLEVSGASAAAKSAIEKAGGKVSVKVAAKTDNKAEKSTS